MTETIDYLGFFWRTEWALPEKCSPDPDLTYDACYQQKFFDKFKENYPQLWKKMDELPLYILDPRRVVRLVNGGHFEGTVAMRVLRSINTLLSLKCTMATKVKLDQEYEVMIGDDVKPYRITAVELGWGTDALLALAQQKYEKYIHCLNILGAGSAGGENKACPQSDVKGMRNQRVHRQLSMVANDPRWDEVTFRRPAEAPKPGKAPELMPAATQYRMLASPDCATTEWLSYAKNLPMDPVPCDRVGKAQGLASGEPKLLYLAKNL